MQSIKGNCLLTLHLVNVKYSSNYLKTSHGNFVIEATKPIVMSLFVKGLITLVDWVKDLIVRQFKVQMW